MLNHLYTSTFGFLFIYILYRYCLTCLSEYKANKSYFSMSVITCNLCDVSMVYEYP